MTKIIPSPTLRVTQTLRGWAVEVTMTTGNIKQRPKTRPRGAKHSNSHNSPKSVFTEPRGGDKAGMDGLEMVKGSFPEMDMPGSISQIYQQQIQSIVDLARDRILKMARDELEGIFSEMEVRFQGLLEDSDTDVSPQNITPHQEGSKPRWKMPEAKKVDTKDLPDLKELVPIQETEQVTQNQEVSSDLPNSEEDASDGEEEQMAYQQEVRLELPPPLDLRPLLGFYRDLETKDVRILRALGSLDKGVSLYIRPRQLASVTQLLQTLPGVQEVRDEAPTAEVEAAGGEGASNRLILRILLTPTG